LDIIRKIVEIIENVVHIIVVIDIHILDSIIDAIDVHHNLIVWIIHIVLIVH